ncbi:MAG TPA: universal stress protein [Candidatus Brocadiia bacterium]|nr:universal stress protein [Candidatus Brocadiia bacterium]
MQLKKILVPVDFSRFSEHALDYAVALAQDFGAQLFLLKVVAPVSMPQYLEELASSHSEIIGQEADNSVAKLSELAERCRSYGVQVEAELARGEVSETIARTAAKLGADMIVMGTHGRTGLRHVLLGSVAEKTLRIAECPVLTVKIKEHEFVMPGASFNPESATPV